MTVAECIDLYDREHPNDTDMELKMRWLKTVDNAVINEVVKTHWERRGTEIDEETYFDDWDENKDLLIPDPHIDVYHYYMDARIKMMRNESKGIERAMTLYNNAYLIYQQYYNRTHPPKQPRKRYIQHTRL